MHSPCLNRKDRNVSAVGSIHYISGALRLFQRFVCESPDNVRHSLVQHLLVSPRTGCYAVVSTGAPVTRTPVRVMLLPLGWEHLHRQEKSTSVVVSLGVRTLGCSVDYECTGINCGVLSQDRLDGASVCPRARTAHEDPHAVVARSHGVATSSSHEKPQRAHLTSRCGSYPPCELL